MKREPTAHRVVPVSETQLNDVQLIIDEVGRFLKMDFQEWVAHIHVHPEDKFCSLPHPLGSGHLNCGRAAYEAFRRLTIFSISSQPDRLDFDRGETEKEIRRQFVEFFLRQRRTDDAAVDEMMEETLTRSASRHHPYTHWLPCVLFHTKHTDDFLVGPVRFFSREKFFAEHNPQFDDLRKREREVTLAAVRDEKKLPNLPYKTEGEATRLADDIVAWITDYFSSYEWVAEVSVQPCAPEISRERAANAIQGALDVLKMHFGTRAKGIRLGHDRGQREKVAGWRRDNDGGRFTWMSSRRSENISVQETWFEDVIAPNRFCFDSAAESLNGYLDPADDSELAIRFRDALFWYGQAISEPVISAKIVKLAACLERLTITSQHSGFAKTVVSRVGFLCGGSTKGERTKRSEANKVYDCRSFLMHGKLSPFREEEIRDIAWSGIALARNSLFSFIHVCRWLSEEGLPLSDTSLESFYMRELRGARPTREPSEKVAGSDTLEST